MVAKRPADRPQSMTEVLLELENCRSTPREASDASTELKSFPRTVVARRKTHLPIPPSSPRENNTSSDELAFDPDLNLETSSPTSARSHPQPPHRRQLPPRPPRLKPPAPAAVVSEPVEAPPVAPWPSPTSALPPCSTSFGPGLNPSNLRLPRIAPPCW